MQGEFFNQIRIHQQLIDGGRVRNKRGAHIVMLFFHSFVRFGLTIKNNHIFSFYYCTKKDQKMKNL